MKFVLTDRKWNELKTLFRGQERVGDQYILPLEFSKITYTSSLERRKWYEVIFALVDLVISMFLDVILKILTRVLKSVKSVYYYLFFDEHDRRFISDVTIFDWSGRIIKNDPVLRNRVSLIKATIDVPERVLGDDLLKNNY